MKFEEAFDKAFDQRKEHDAKKDRKFGVLRPTFETLAFMWSMLAVADFVLDDTVVIGDNDTIISTPVIRAEKKGKDEKAPKTPKDKKNQGEENNGQTSSIDKTASDEKIEGGNVEKEKETAADKQ